VPAAPDLHAAIAALLRDAGLPDGLADRVEVRGADPASPSPFRLGEAAAIAIGACAAAASWLWELRGGSPQRVVVDVAHAVTALNGWSALRVDGEPLPAPHVGNPLYDMFRCRDGRWLQLQAGLPVLVERTLRVLRCGPGRDEIAAAVARWDAPELEEALAAGDACGAIVRTSAEWAATVQGAHLAAGPVLSVRRLGESPPEPLPFADRPLGGVRVLDLTRVIAGPVNGRTLAEHGASVLLVSSPHHANVLSAMLDTGWGKRSALLDLAVPAQRERLRELARGADVFSQGFRPGALARLGFGLEAIAELRPGAVYASISCFGTTGPWAERRGWEQIAQAATGLAVGQGTAERPQLLPLAACDYVTGYLAALGSIAGLVRRHETGGTYAVEASLCRTGMWIAGLGTAAGAAAAAPAPPPGSLSERATAYGTLVHVAPVAQLSLTPAAWHRPVEPPGRSPARWTEEARQPA
jgi:crotonobetainyl-CoA:carnitine CoA-transferase CaiB-like acyl-CoA transferase